MTLFKKKKMIDFTPTIEFPEKTMKFKKGRKFMTLKFKGAKKY